MTCSNPIRRIAMTTLGAMALACAPATAQDGMKSVDLRTADGQSAGTATFTQARHGVIITLDLRNLTPGPHGLHIHETGACTPDFKAAGGHYNPIDSEHGFDSEGGYHVGDLPNISVAADGVARGDIFVPQVSLTGPENDRYPFTLQDADGSAIMVHARADDYRNMASSGERAACGVIIPTSE
ncbi:MAG: Cu/Zn superoxide dismutase [Porphyrobacter sp. HL-46]|nr:MAG: Cu/Zn superoxide dismutase [Porphyrobacter sp. HL-46]